MTRLLHRLFRRPAALPRRPPRPATAEPAAGEDERPRGCGWFDSSHDLLTGVIVWEGMIVVDNTPARPS